MSCPGLVLTAIIEKMVESHGMEQKLSKERVMSEIFILRLHQADSRNFKEQKSFHCCMNCEV